MDFFFEENGRGSTRHETIGLMSDITDGKTNIVGVVEDISTKGLRVSHVPTNFNDTVGRCYSVVNGPAMDYAFALHPRWVKITNNGMYKMIGFEILNPPASWGDFVESIKEDMDPFGTIIPETSGNE